MPAEARIELLIVEISLVFSEIDERNSATIKRNIFTQKLAGFVRDIRESQISIVHSVYIYCLHPAIFERIHTLIKQIKEFIKC